MDVYIPTVTGKRVISVNRFTHQFIFVSSANTRFVSLFIACILCTWSSSQSAYLFKFTHVFFRHEFLIHIRAPRSYVTAVEIRGTGHGGFELFWSEIDRERFLKHTWPVYSGLVLNKSRGKRHQFCVICFFFLLIKKKTCLRD